MLAYFILTGAKHILPYKQIFIYILNNKVNPR